MSDPVRTFYQHNLPDLSPITDLPHRHFRILLPCGTFFKVQDRIRDAATLQQWLIRYRPSDVYYSTSCWLAPESLGRRERTPLSGNIFLSSDIVFDIDQSPYSIANLECARQNTLRLIALCADQHIPVKYIAFSGSKGFHVVCSDTKRYDHPHPLVREDMAKAVRKEIIARVITKGIVFDTKITGDTRRIIRVPGTINSKNGYVCTVLTLEQLQKPVSAILKYIPRVDPITPVIPPMGDESPFQGTRIISWFRNRFGVRSKPVSPFSFATFLVNAVPGIDRQIPFFVYPARRNLDRIESELKTMQEIYGLSDIYLYRSEKEITAVCLRTFPLRRLEKIIGASTSINYGTILKYRQLFFRIGETRDEYQQVLVATPRYETTIRAPEANNQHFVSLPHLRFFSEGSLPMRTYQRMHGTGDVFLTHTIIEQ
jgi:hypothetical protein